MKKIEHVEHEQGDVVVGMHVQVFGEPGTSIA